MEYGDFHYLDGLKLRTLCAIMIFSAFFAADHIYTKENQKNALVQAIAYTGRSDFITKTFDFDSDGTFLKHIQSRIETWFPNLSS